MADEGKSYNEHDDRVSFPQRRKKGRGPFRWKCGEGNRRSGRGGSGIRSSRFEEDDGDVAMNDPQDGPRVRYNPYTSRPNRRRDTWHDRDRIHVTVRRDRAPQERGGAGTSQDGTTKNWFKITIPYGKKYDKMWLLSMIQSKCSVPFNPIEFHYENTRAQFFVEDATTASALKAVNYKIQDRENRRISIIINSSAPPYIVQNELKPEQVEQLKLIMSKRYDGSQQALDLKGLRSDPDLVAQNIDVVLNRRGCMAAALRIIEENIPELLSLNLSNNRLYKLDDMSSISSISTLLDAQGFSDLERSTSSTPGMGSPSRDPLHTSAPEEFHTSVLQASVPSLFPTSMDEETCEKPKLATKPETSFEEGDGRAVLGADAEVSLSDGVSTSSLQKSSSLGNLKKETSDGVDKTPTDSHTFGTLPPKAPGHGASVDDSPFGTRKARSSFGRGFFKIKSGKRTASAPNLAVTLAL